MKVRDSIGKDVEIDRFEVLVVREDVTSVFSYLVYGYKDCINEDGQLDSLCIFLNAFETVQDAYEYMDKEFAKNQKPEVTG